MQVTSIYDMIVIGKNLIKQKVYGGYAYEEVIINFFNNFNDTLRFGL